jgi:hypothetical protein
MKLFVYLFLIFGMQSCKEHTNLYKIYGKWYISNAVFDETPSKSELEYALKNCVNQEVVISESKFSFRAKKCFLYQEVDNFKVTKHYTLNYKDAQSYPEYSDKLLFYLFNDGKRKYVDAYKTNYTFDSDEGEVPELEIFCIDENHIIINQFGNIVFLNRK